MRDQLGERLPRLTDSELALLREADLDFYGMNYYTAQFGRHRTTPAPDTDFIGNLDELQENKNGISIGDPSGVFWLRSAPSCFRKHLVRAYKRYGKTIYITENGCPCPGEDTMTRDESVKDDYRQRYFSEHLDALVQARQDGAEVAGYFAWSLLDNFGKVLQLDTALATPGLTRFVEWFSGYDIRFGVTFTDYETLERTPKQSALMIQDMIKQRTQAAS